MIKRSLIFKATYLCTSKRSPHLRPVLCTNMQTGTIKRQSTSSTLEQSSSRAVNSQWALLENALN